MKQFKLNNWNANHVSNKEIFPLNINFIEFASNEKINRITFFNSLILNSHS